MRQPDEERPGRGQGLRPGPATTPPVQAPTSWVRSRPHHGSFTQVDLVADVPGHGAGVLVDPAVKNPWGIDFGPATPLWVSNQFSDTVTVYAGATTAPAVRKLPVQVDADDPTGMVFNPTQSFAISEGGLTAPSNFLWNENANVFDPVPSGPPAGRIVGWSNVTAPPPPRNSRVVEVTTQPGGYGGLALVPATRHHGPRLLAANLVTGAVDVFDGEFAPVRGRRLFVDPKAQEQGLTPYNVTYLDGRVYVAYAFGGGQVSDAVSVFTRRGRFVERLVSDSRLAAPWGMAVAPHHWGRFGGALLVGNVDDGIINAFDRHDGHWLGAVEDENGHPLVNPGLWGLKFGNGVFGDPDDLIFAAGVGNEVGNEVYEHGLIGKITPTGDESGD